MTDSGYHIGLEEAVLRAKRRATAADEEGTWPMQLAADLRELGANWQESADACADVAWAARAAQRSVLRLMQPAQTTGHGADEATERTYRHLYLSSLRFDFRCRAVQTLVGEGVSLSQLSRDPYTAALYAFAFLGQSKSRGLNLMEEVLSRAGDHPKTLHVLVHGLWLGQELPGRAEHILQLLARPPSRRALIRSRCSARPALCAAWATTVPRWLRSVVPWTCCRPATPPCTPTSSGSVR